MSILVVVESPNKIGKIQSILGSKYKVAASVGHIRDLDPNPKEGLSIDIEHDFKPIYVITKPDVVKNLKNLMSHSSSLLISTDKDDEGESIGKSVVDILKPKEYKRIVFTSITKEAILESLKHAGPIDENSVFGTIIASSYRSFMGIFSQSSFK